MGKVQIGKQKEQQKAFAYKNNMKNGFKREGKAWSKDYNIRD